MAAGRAAGRGGPRRPAGPRTGAARALAALLPSALLAGLLLRGGPRRPAGAAAAFAGGGHCPVGRDGGRWCTPRPAGTSLEVLEGTSRAMLEEKLRTWVSKAASLGLDPPAVLPGLRGTFLQGLPEIVTDDEFDEVARRVLENARLGGTEVASPPSSPPPVEGAAELAAAAAAAAAPAAAEPAPPAAAAAQPAPPAAEPAPPAAAAAAAAAPAAAGPGPAALGGPTPLEEGGAASVPLYWASAAYFDAEHLESDGVWDDGSHASKTRTLYDDGAVSVGAWTCTAGSFPVGCRSTTEWFHVIEGEGIITDADGTPHVFRAGDTVVLPKGWCGRWDVMTAVRKIWVISDHAEELGADEARRAIVGPVNELASWEKYTPLGKRKADWGEPEHFTQKLWAAGPTSAGSWACTEGGFLGSPNRPTTEVFYVLEGLCFLTGLDGIARRVAAGDTVILPKGWSGRWDVVKPIRKVWAVVK